MEQTRVTIVTSNNSSKTTVHIIFDDPSAVTDLKFIYININHFNLIIQKTQEQHAKEKKLQQEKKKKQLNKNKKYRVRQRGCSLTHSTRTPPAFHPGITIWIDEIEIEKKSMFFFLNKIELEKN